MVSSAFRRVKLRGEIEDAHNHNASIALGDTGGRIKLRGYDGVELNPATGATLSSGNYPLDVGSDVTQKLRIRNTADSADLLTVLNTGVTIGTDLTVTGTFTPTGNLAITGTLTATVNSASSFNNAFVNTNNANANANSVVAISTGGASGGDPVLQWAITGVVTWSAGLDNSASDVWTLAASSALGTTNVLTVTSAGAATLTGTLTATTSSTGAVNNSFSNTDNTNANANCVVAIASGGGSGGDPVLQWLITGVVTWSAGLDNSASDIWTLAASTALGTTNVLTATSAGAVTVTGAVTAGTPALVFGATAFAAGTIYSTTNNGYGIGLKGGAVRDLLVSGPAGATILEVPMGTTGVTFQGGVVLAGATGGDLGAGTLNCATNLYKNNSAYTNPDYALEHWATGRIVVHADKPGAADYPGLLPIREVEAYARAHYRLPRVSEGQPAGIFDMADICLEKIEELHLYLFDHERRLRQLEGGARV